MASLRNRLENIPQGVKVWLPMIPILVVALLVYFLILSPKAGTIEQLRSDTRQVQMQVDAERRLLASFEPLTKKEAGRIKATDRAIEKLTKDLTSREEIYDRVARKAKECNVIGIAIDPSHTPTKQEKEMQYTNIEADMSLVKLTFYSDLESLGCLLKDVGKKKAMMVESLAVTRELPKPKIEAVFRIFAKKEEQ